GGWRRGGTRQGDDRRRHLLQPPERRHRRRCAQPGARGRRSRPRGSGHVRAALACDPWRRAGGATDAPEHRERPVQRRRVGALRPGAPRRRHADRSPDCHIQPPPAADRLAARSSACTANSDAALPQLDLPSLTASPTLPIALSRTHSSGARRGIAGVLLWAALAAIAWGALAFGAVYPWAYTPLMLGCAFIGVTAILVLRRRGPPLGALAAGLSALAIAPA